MLFAAIFIAALIPSHIKAWIKHPMVTSVKTWALARLLSNGDLGSILLFGAFLLWGGYARVAAKRRGDRGFANPPAGWANGIVGRTRRRRLFPARLLLPSLRHRRPGVCAQRMIPKSGNRFSDKIMRKSNKSCRTIRSPSSDRTRHSRAQRRRADRLPDLLSRAYRGDRRQALRRDPGRQLARHGDARAREHGSRHTRHDDPAGPRGDARLQACAGGGRHAVRLLRSLERAGLHYLRARVKGNRLRRRQARRRRRMAETIAFSPSAACRSWAMSG